MEQEKRNIKGGKNYKKFKSRRERAQPKQHTSINIDEGDGYIATVLEIQGGNKVKVKTHNNTEETVIIPGRMRKGRRGNWIKPGMDILVNSEYEIVKIIRGTDKEAVMARNIMDKISSNNTYFALQDDSSSDDDELEYDSNNENLNKLITTNPNKKSNINKSSSEQDSESIDEENEEDEEDQDEEDQDEEDQDEEDQDEQDQDEQDQDEEDYEQVDFKNLKYKKNNDDIDIDNI
jgi:translation initiation factor IF-1